MYSGFEQQQLLGLSSIIFGLLDHPEGYICLFLAIILLFFINDMVMVCWCWLKRDKFDKH